MYLEKKVLNKAKGGILKGVYLRIDDAIALKIDDKFWVFGTDGDCCSETYISDIVKNISLKEYPQNSFWKDDILYKIVSIEEIDLKEGEYLPRESRQEEDRVYGLKILLECESDDPNSITIVYRNSSNGYYGGNMFLNIKEKLPETFNLIKYDFHNHF